jgi:RNA polymerase sigma-70 factor, ECF subfamily
VTGDLCRYFIRICGPTDAEDLAHDALLIAYQKWHDAPDTLNEQRAWAFGIARNLAKAANRKNRIRAQILAKLPVPATTIPSPEVGLASLDYARHLLNTLSPKERDAIYFVVIEQLSISEAAQILNCSNTAVSSNLLRGKTKLTALPKSEQNEVHQK